MTRARAVLCLFLASSTFFSSERLYGIDEKPLASEIFDSALSQSEKIETSDAASVEFELWSAYQASVLADTERLKAFEAKALPFGDKTKRFTVDIRGEKPAGGYPLYIALHGGGGTGTSVNDSQWRAMQSYYRDSVAQGIYVATRGVTDTWNLHFVEESYTLYDELIQMMIATKDVDPNRVYLLGFSAGGDGVYQITPRMADRWAAANMSAGHHNWIRFDNLYQTPFLIQMGENDTAYKRNTVAAENHNELNRLQALRGGYIHETFIHRNGSHNSWRDNDASGRDQTILSKPSEWLSSQNKDTTTRNTNAVQWLNQYTRNPQPSSLVWDPKTNAKRSRSAGAAYASTSVAATIGQPQNLFFWLDVSESDLSAEKILIEARYDTIQNEIHLAGIDSLQSIRVLLRPEMLDFERPVQVWVDGTSIGRINLERDRKVMARTLLERGDPAFLFHSEILLTKGKTWGITNSPTAKTPFQNSYPYAYCSKDSCRTVRSQPSFFFGQLPESVATHCLEPNTYAMTFDDGPSDSYPQVLDILQKHEVPATFFVLGQNLLSEKNQGFIKTAHQQGHQISNHGYSHRDLMKLSDEDLVKEVGSTREALTQILGDAPDIRRDASLVRPPFGYLTQREEDLLIEGDFQSVRWNSDRSDWELAASENPVDLKRVDQHLQFVKQQSLAGFNNSIIDLNHDYSGATLANLDEIIRRVKGQGYRFVTLRECLGGPRK